MKYLTRFCVATTCVSAVSLLVLWNTALALQATTHRCIVLFEVPFTDKSFPVPDWMWGPIPLSFWAISTLTAVTFWITLLIKRVRLRLVQG